MKNTLTVLLLALMFCGCSKKPATSLIQPGADVSLKLGTGSCILHVTKRDGASIQGVRLVTKDAAGKETTFSADSGTVSESSDSVTITLASGQLQDGTKLANFTSMGPLVLTR